MHLEFSFEPSDSCTLWISVDPQLVVTARTKPLRSADVVVQIVRDATSRIGAIEDDLLAARLDNMRARLGGLEFSVVLRDMQALQERIKVLQEEIAANVNEDNNISLLVPTVVTVLALPINIIGRPVRHKRRRHSAGRTQAGLLDRGGAHHELHRGGGAAGFPQEEGTLAGRLRQVLRVRDARHKIRACKTS